MGILFRGQRIANGEHVEGFYTKTSFGIGLSDSIVTFDGATTKIFRIIPESIEVKLFDNWIKLNELNKYKLIEVQ